MSHNVVITETLDPRAAQWLAKHANVVQCSHEDAGFADALAAADGLIVRTYTQVNKDLLKLAPNLRVVGRAGVGLDNIDLKACRRRKIKVVYTPDANTQAVVEYVLGLMLDVVRPRTLLPAGADARLFHEMRKTQVGTQLDRLTLGILGFGRIGTHLGRVAHALGMSLLVNDLLPETELRKKVDYPFDFVDKPTLYARSDVLTLHVDGRPENRELIDADVLAKLKPACLLINAARGMLIDHVALYEWLALNTEAGARAVLDVHDPEPPPRDHPLFNLPNARMLPHLASRTETALTNMSWVVNDVIAVLEGKDPVYPA